MNSVSILSNYTHLLPACSDANELASLKLTGPDSIKFLQGQTSCDFNQLTQEAGLQGAICNIKGRVIANFYALQQAEDILLIMASDLLETVLNHLKKFAVFFKTQLSSAKDDFHIEYVYSGTSLFENDKTPYQHQRIEESHSLLAISQDELNQYLYLRPIQADRSSKLPALNQQIKGLHFVSGQAFIHQESSEKFIPQMLNMQLTQGISFKKGCYTGQEIVARMQYRGNLKKHLYLLSATTELNIPNGAKLSNQEGKDVAELVNSTVLSNHTLIYAIIGDESAQKPLFWQDIALTLEPLPYS